MDKMEIHTTTFKPVCGTASKYGCQQVIICLCAWHISSWPQAVQQNRCITARRNSVAQLILAFLMQNPSKQDINGPLMQAVKDSDITINAQCYCRTLRDLRTAITRKHPGTLMRGVTVLHDNAHPHVASTVSDMLHSMHWKVLDHPPYSPGLLLCDFHVSGLLKRAKEPQIQVTQRCQGHSVVQWFQQQPRSSLHRRSTDWCINGMPASAFTGTTFNRIYSLPRTIPKQVSFKQTSHIHFMHWV
jgi:hypothetical protein